MLDKINKFLVENTFVSLFILLCIILAGIYVSPFGELSSELPSNPVAVDAIPDLGENQQIVYTEWPGQSPRDIEDQITYPLSTSLMGLPGVKSIRSSSMVGLSTIYVIFEDDIDFYWSRSRILEKLNALPSDLIPDEVTPSLGPDATGLGQVYWYTIEAFDQDGRASEGWDLHEIRSVQDFQVKYALNSTPGVSEVASIGGYSLEYQVDMDPLAMQSYGVSLNEVMKAIQGANVEVGARTMEINKAEYFVRGLGYVKNLDDLRDAAVKQVDGTTIRLRDVARVNHGPAERRGVLDKEGREVVGGVITARYGTNPLEVIDAIKEKIASIESSLPSKKLKDGRISKLKIVPFYDRSILIKETLFTLEYALILEILITVLVVVVLIRNLRSSLLISSMVPLAILLVFVGMKLLNIDANIVSLSGIAIAIGTMVDLGIILSENIDRHLEEGDERIPSILRATSEVRGAILTAVSTTIISFIPVFALEGAEGKLFGPLAWTKTLALIAAALVTLFVLPTLSALFLKRKSSKTNRAWIFSIILLGLAFYGFQSSMISEAIILCIWAIANVFKSRIYLTLGKRRLTYDSLELILAILLSIVLLNRVWRPLSLNTGLFTNLLFTALLVGIIIGFFLIINKYYKVILERCLQHRIAVITVPILLIIFGLLAWLGSPFDRSSENPVIASINKTFPGISKEFMPSLDEGSFLLMPTTMAHSGIEYNMDVLSKLDQLSTLVPEVNLAVGKLGRVESALDPAPISMFENIIQYRSEYMSDELGRIRLYRIDQDERFVLSDERTLSNDEALQVENIRELLIPDDSGRPFRNWRSKIQSSNDIWNEISNSTKLLGVTGAPKLQPIETRLIMLQTGMRAPMGIKVYGPDLATIEAFGLELEQVLKTAAGVKHAAVFADRVVGKPYIEIEPNRLELQRYGLSVGDLNNTLRIALGGMTLGNTVEGRERYPIRLRYPRELREQPEDIKRILIDLPTGEKIELGELAEVKYQKGPQSIKSEDSFLTSYVLFDKADGYSETDAVDAARAAIARAIESGEIEMPSGVSYKFSGNYENQIRAEKRLSIIIPIALLVIIFVLYLQFRSFATTGIVFTGVAISFAGGFLLLWLTNQAGFFDFNIMGQSAKELFHLDQHNLSVAVWVGFIALFGIATDDGVLMATHIDQQLKRINPTTRAEVKETIVAAGQRRIRPAVMTSTTTILALLPILTSTGKGSDIMIPMAIPALGGMLVAVITYFTVPLLYAWVTEKRIEA